MGLFDEFKRLAHPDEDEEEFEDFEPPAPRASERRERRPASRELDDFDFGDPSNRKNKVVNIHTTTQVQVFIAKPERFDNASEIADQLREKRTIVLNLESAEPKIAVRILDFLSGVAYAIDGKIKKVADSTYMITPYNVDILGDLLDELGNNGIHFNDKHF